MHLKNGGNGWEETKLKGITESEMELPVIKSVHHLPTRLLEEHISLLHQCRAWPSILLWPNCTQSVLSPRLLVSAYNLVWLIGCWQKLNMFSHHWACSLDTFPSQEEPALALLPFQGGWGKGRAQLPPLNLQKPQEAQLSFPDRRAQISQLEPTLRNTINNNLFFKSLHFGVVSYPEMTN